MDRDTNPNHHALFDTIPPDSWLAAWANIHSSDPLRATAGLYFWIGVCLSATLDDPNYCDKELLARTALTVYASQEPEGQP